MSEQSKGHRENESSDVSGELDEVLQNFRSSVHAWSEAAYARPRSAVKAPSRRRVWQLVAGWALGCALLTGGISTGIYQQHSRAEQARQQQIQQEQQRLTAAREAEHQRQLAAEQALEEEDLLAKVDSDVARQVPKAMEPLAQLMTNSGD